MFNALHRKEQWKNTRGKTWSHYTLFFFLDKSLHTFLKTLMNNKFYATSKGNCPELKKILYPTSQWKMDPSKLPLTKYSSWNGCQAKADNWKQKCNISINVSKITSSFFGGGGVGGCVQKFMSCKLRKKCISIKTSELLVMLVKNLLINSFATSTEAWQP